ncbi:uncharacterized protein OCT59_012335 [Rhizophagus irregularis]|uniref:uncharacterized protein n=1 Tax=Rhizophagus irregularis TaxID=588596 RepID=UPI0033318146|nr:hypothetical protein OCT59_012335 [Rhizophagus irregularis]
MRNHKKFEERSYYIPDLFLEFFDHANPESYKQSRKLFDANELNLHCQALAPYSTSSWMLMTNFNWLHDAFDDFIIAISATTIKIHKRNTWITPLDKSKYYHLEQVLVNSSLWKHIDIEEYLPIDPVQRLRFIQGLSCAFFFTIGEYRFNSGNNTFNMISIWKIDEDANESIIL